MEPKLDLLGGTLGLYTRGKYLGGLQLGGYNIEGLQLGGYNYLMGKHFNLGGILDISGIHLHLYY